MEQFERVNALFHFGNRCGELKAESTIARIFSAGRSSPINADKILLLRVTKSSANSASISSNFGNCAGKTVLDYGLTLGELLDQRRLVHHFLYVV